MFNALVRPGGRGGGGEGGGGGGGGEDGIATGLEIRSRAQQGPG